MASHPLVNRTLRPSLVRSGLLVAGLVMAIGVGPLLLPADARAETPTIQVYKTPTCGCCSKWIDHLRAAGFDVEATDLPDLTALKAMNGVPNGLSSCHTAMVEGYVIEGHVPASDITRLLVERPKIAGLTVPGMPMGSPGMEHPDASRHEAYEVLAFGAASGPEEDRVKVFSRHPPSRGPASTSR